MSARWYLLAPVAHVPQWFDLPNGVQDWARNGERVTYWLPLDPTPADRVAAWRQVAEWDTLVGRLIRVSLFDDGADSRQVRKLAEAVAAVSESLASRLAPRP